MGAAMTAMAEAFSRAGLSVPGLSNAGMPGLPRQRAPYLSAEDRRRRDVVRGWIEERHRRLEAVIDAKETVRARCDFTEKIFHGDRRRRKFSSCQLDVCVAWRSGVWKSVSPSDWRSSWRPDRPELCQGADIARGQRDRRG
jgi:hypothetical protein